MPTKSDDTWVNTTVDDLPAPMRKAHDAVVKAEQERLKAFQKHLEETKQMNGKSYVATVTTRGTSIGICFSDSPPRTSGGRNSVRFK